MWGVAVAEPAESQVRSPAISDLIQEVSFGECALPAAQCAASKANPAQMQRALTRLKQQLIPPLVRVVMGHTATADFCSSCRVTQSPA